MDDGPPPEVEVVASARAEGSEIAQVSDHELQLKIQRVEKHLLSEIGSQLVDNGDKLRVCIQQMQAGHDRRKRVRDTKDAGQGNAYRLVMKNSNFSLSPPNTKHTTVRDRNNGKIVGTVNSNEEQPTSPNRPPLSSWEARNEGDEEPLPTEPLAATLRCIVINQRSVQSSIRAILDEQSELRYMQGMMMREIREMRDLIEECTLESQGDSNVRG